VDNILGILPDFEGIMFHPARLRKNLLVLLLIDSDDFSAMIKNDKTIAGRALV
jgi:hypothetical protein